MTRHRFWQKVGPSMDNTGDISHAVTATGVTVLGVATGLSYEVLLAGFAGGLVSLSYSTPQGVWGRVWTLTTATLVAGYTAPLVVPLMGATEGGMPLVSAGFLSGLFGQALIPPLAQRIKSLIAAQTAQQGDGQ